MYLNCTYHTGGRAHVEQCNDIKHQHEHFGQGPALRSTINSY